MAFARQPGFIPEEAGDPDVWIGLGAASFEVPSLPKVSFIAQTVNEQGGNRIPRRDRPWQRAAKLDFVGNKSDEFSIDCIFNPDVAEGDIKVVYPDDVERFVAALKTGETGTLDLPWKRGLRVKADEWTRTEVASENRGGAIVRVKFCEDNEDTLDREAFEVVTVKATAERQVEAAQFDAESEGMDLLAIEDLTELAANVVGLLNYPADNAAALLHAGNRLRLACKTVLEAFTTDDPGRDQMNGPNGAAARQMLLELKELGARAVGEARPRATRVMTFPKNRDIYSIATELGQNARELMKINEQIEDFGFIEAGTPVRVFA